jgi:predicted cupin superfamily sugar epimerase
MENYIKELVQKFDLLPHPEGGYYKEVYRSEGVIAQSQLGNQFSGDRNYCTSIYFLLTSANFSGFHRIKQDEVWHFYQGSPLQIHVIHPNGQYELHRIGFDLTQNLTPQFVVPAGAWFASSVENENDFSLVGCTVAPGFDFDDFELAKRTELIALYPQHAQIITQLTKQ